MKNGLINLFERPNHCLIINTLLSTFDFPERILTPITSLFYLHFDTKIIPIPPIIEKFDTIHLSQYHQQI